jgi:hypothetical protein
MATGAAVPFVTARPVFPDDVLWIEVPEALPRENWAETTAFAVVAKAAASGAPDPEPDLIRSLQAAISAAQRDRGEADAAHHLLVFPALDLPPIPVQVALWAPTSPWRKAKWSYLGGSGAGVFRKPRLERVGILDTPAGALRTVRYGILKADPAREVARVMYAWRSDRPEADCQVAATLGASELAVGLPVVDGFVHGIVLIDGSLDGASA